MRTKTLILETNPWRLEIPSLLLAAMAMLVFLCAAPTTRAQVSGAVFTTDNTCSGVDLNIYGQKGDVYINGGPSHPGAAGLPNGSYCVQVTDPSGSTVLGTSAPGAVSVSGGDFVQCYSLFDLTSFGDTPNPGGEYKVWVTPYTDGACDFTNSLTKTDNFKVREGGGGPGETATICVTKFYDANANGVKDGNEQDIAGWQFKLFADDNLLLTRYTPRCMVVDPGNYHVIESTPVELNWVHTTPTDVQATVAANDTANVSFGNVCLGPGGGLTLGFWSNKNGQKLENADDFALLTSLNLRNASGGNQDFTGTVTQNRTALNTWLLNATATNMAYMLSAQLAAMELNVLNGFVSGSALVYEDCLSNYGYPSGFISVNDLMTAANNELGLHGLTKDGSPYRAYQECLKNALDDANNNKNFVESSPCPFSFGD